MDKEVFETSLLSTLNKNFEEYNSFYDYQYKVFYELRTTHSEITNCLILEFYKAAITLTNYFLERLLKLALIKSEVGIGPKPVENWNSNYSNASKKYDGMLLSKTIKECRINGIINEDEKTFLDEEIREMVRNGFSHADPKQILKDMPDSAPLFHGNINNPTQLTKMELCPKEIPFLQTVVIDDFSQQFASYYFRNIFNILINIENRLIVKAGNK